MVHQLLPHRHLFLSSEASDICLSLVLGPELLSEPTMLLSVIHDINNPFNKFIILLTVHLRVHLEFTSQLFKKNSILFLYP